MKIAEGDKIAFDLEDFCVWIFKQDGSEWFFLNDEPTYEMKFLGDMDKLVEKQNACRRIGVIVSEMLGFDFDVWVRDHEIRFTFYGPVRTGIRGKVTFTEKCEVFLKTENLWYSFFVKPRRGRLLKWRSGIKHVDLSSIVPRDSSISLALERFNEIIGLLALIQGFEAQRLWANQFLAKYKLVKMREN